MHATGPQIVAARALLQWTQSELAERSKVAASTIKRLEAMAGPLSANPATIDAILRALAEAGVMLLDEGDMTDGGRGVRLVKGASE